MWHADIMEFLELKNNRGFEELRTRNINLAVMVPDSLYVPFLYDMTTLSFLLA